MPVVSVVIPAFNAERTVLSAVESALRQTIADVEVLVVDDGSSDGTRSVLAAIRDARVSVLSQENRGPAAARNVGIEAASSPLVAFLDSDDLWLPDYLERARTGIARQARPGFAYTDAWAFDPRSGKVRTRSVMAPMRPPDPPPRRPEAFLLELLRRNFVFTSTVVPRSVLLGVGGFDPELLRAEDYDLWIRIVAHGFTPVWVPGRHVLYRVHDGQVTADTQTLDQEFLRMYERMDEALMPEAEHVDLLRRRRQEAARSLEAATGTTGWRCRRRQARRRLGGLRRRIGLGEVWQPPPPEIVRAYPDLSAV